MSADYRHANWRKSSNGNGGTCVELAHLRQHSAIGDSKNPGGPMLVFGPGALTALLACAEDRET